ncbi:hypothetical protein CPC08DRAFT_712994 [Agrocybe pediades]|nr:hypothetical protein CPC08DRAFT_712994 [Agrocybe pediades]
MSFILTNDRDPSIIYNANHWSHENNPNEFNGTSTFCNVAGGTATFKFDGSGIISVTGLIQAMGFQASGRSSYSIDGSPPQIHVPSVGNTTQFNVDFFETFVPSGSHTLLITTLDENKFVYLDYILFSKPLPEKIPGTAVIPVPNFSTTLPATTVMQSITSTTSSPDAQPVLSPSSSLVVTTPAPKSSELLNPPALSQTSPTSDSLAMLNEPSGSLHGTGTFHPDSLSARTTTAPGTLSRKTAPSSLSQMSSAGVITLKDTSLSPSSSHASVPPGADKTTAPQVAPTQHVSLGVIIGPIIGLLVLVALIGMLLGRICYARAMKRPLLISDSP